MEKKTEAMTVHLSDKRKKQVLLLADDSGVTGSEFINFLIDAHLEKSLRTFSVLEQVALIERTNESGENR
jgi:hypothetical protein